RSPPAPGHSTAPGRWRRRPPQAKVGWAWLRPPFRIFLSIIAETAGLRVTKSSDSGPGPGKKPAKKAALQKRVLQRGLGMPFWVGGSGEAGGFGPGQAEDEILPRDAGAQV